MQQPSSKGFNKTLFFIFALGSLCVIFSSFYNLYIKKDYIFIIEASCDSQTQLCFQRDCEITDACPANNLSIYKVFEISASDFEKCKDGSCEDKCRQEDIVCNEVICNEEGGDSCIFTPADPIEYETSLTESVVQ